MEDYKVVCQDHLAQREIGLAQRADRFGWLSFENQRKEVGSFCGGNAEKLDESFGQGHLVDKITANSSIYSCESSNLYVIDD